MKTVVSFIQASCDNIENSMCMHFITYKGGNIGGQEGLQAPHFNSKGG